MLISLRYSALFRSLFYFNILTLLFRIKCRMFVSVGIYTCLCPCIFHLTTLPECSFNDTSEKFNKRTKELFWDAGGWRNWKTNLGRIPLFASFSLIWFQPLRLREISISTTTTVSPVMEICWTYERIITSKNIFKLFLLLYRAMALQRAF